MISIQLPDGSKREFPGPVTVAEVAASIGAGLAKAALAGRVGRGESARLVDTSYRIEADESLAIVTDKDADGLDVIRAVVSAACELLRPGGRVYIEHEDDQGFSAIDSGVPGLLEATGSFTAVEDIRDQGGRPRVAVATFG